MLPVAELSARARARIGAQAEGQSVVTRQGFRVTTRLIPPRLAELLGEFRAPSRLTDAVLHFAQAQGQDPQTLLDAAFDALATLVEARFLMPEDAPEAAAPRPSLVAGQEFAGFEIESPVRSLDDSEVFRARGADGQAVALKIARDARLGVHEVLAHEAHMLRRLRGRDSPALHAQGVHAGRAFLAMEWCSGVLIGVAAQTLRAARDRPRLHVLVTRMLQAYGRLHGLGVLHGEIHPGTAWCVTTAASSSSTSAMRVRSRTPHRASTSLAPASRNSTTLRWPGRCWPACSRRRPVRRRSSTRSLHWPTFC